MGSESDLPIMRQAQEVLENFGVASDMQIVSAHRTPQKMVEFAENAHHEHSLIIAGAGGAAHLPGMIAAVTCLPVIGVPVTTTSLGGLDALLSIAQMPKGVPVATVAVDNAHNAGLLAIRLLAMSDGKLLARLQMHQGQQKKKVAEMQERLTTLFAKKKPSKRAD